MPPSIRSELDVLLDKVEDEALRSALRSQIDRVRQRRSFGLVFEHHIPERVRLPQHPIGIGAHVVDLDDVQSRTWEVVSIGGDVATLRAVRDPDGAYIRPPEHAVADLERRSTESLVVISDFGEPVLPGLRWLGAVERGGDKPCHVVIKGENHHALEMLRFTHAGKVDCIYIDPPYNSGARDWKYDNDYVDENDAYRHSKWLAFMERRLMLAKELLNPDDSVLIVAIDEKEYLRLGLLLHQAFPRASIQMISSVTNPKGTSRFNEFSRTDEYLFFVLVGRVRISPEASENQEAVRWVTLRRSNLANRRAARPNQFYPIYIDSRGAIEHVGDAIPPEVDRGDVPARPGTVAVFPLRPDGTEMMWGLTPGALRKRIEDGYVSVGRYEPTSPQQYVINYLPSGTVHQIALGEIVVTGRRPDGSVTIEYASAKRRMPTTNWSRGSHEAQQHGTNLLTRMLLDRKFPFPKSLYAVEDALRFFVRDKPDAVILDFFAGSGTTAHAVARLNKQDGGRRQCILVTNNEVSADEAAAMRKQGLRPGDPDWEALGIFEHITRPRVEAAISGRTPDGTPIQGDYRFTDEFPMSEGFEENAAFLELRYLDADDVELGQADEDVAPLLWLHAGATGPVARRTDDAGAPVPFVWTERYGVLYDEDRWRRFVEARPASATTAFLVTHSPTSFAGIAAELPTAMSVVRIPDSYLSTFMPDRGRA